MLGARQLLGGRHLGLSTWPCPGLRTTARRASAPGRPRPSRGPRGRNHGVWRRLPLQAGAPPSPFGVCPPAAGHSGTSRHHDSGRSVRGQSAPRGHRPPQAQGAERRPARPPPESGPRAAASTPDVGPGRGPPPPGVRLASQRSASLTFWRRRRWRRLAEGRRTVQRAAEAVGMGGAAVTSRAGAAQEPTRRSQPRRARRKWAGQGSGPGAALRL